VSNQNELQAQIAKLTAENEALKAKAVKAQTISFRVSEKKAVSIYGLSARFPVTLYKSQIDRLFSDETVAKLREFVKANESLLSIKATKE
jgi:hypothetical protein